LAVGATRSALALCVEASPHAATPRARDTHTAGTLPGGAGSATVARAAQVLAVYGVPSARAYLCRGRVERWAQQEREREASSFKVWARATDPGPGETPTPLTCAAGSQRTLPRCPRCRELAGLRLGLAQLGGAKRAPETRLPDCQQPPPSCQQPSTRTRRDHQAHCEVARWWALSVAQLLCSMERSCI